MHSQGDNIGIAFAINDAPIGAVLTPSQNRHMSVAVNGGSAIDYVEVLHNNRIIHRENVYTQLDAAGAEPFAAPVKVHFEVGWGDKGENVDWDVRLEVKNGRLNHIEPRFRGHNIVAPQAGEKESYAFSSWKQRDDNSVNFSTRTWGNPTTTTAGTQGICLQILGDVNTLLQAQINGHTIAVPLSRLIKGPKSYYLGDQFMSPAAYFHRAIPEVEYSCQFAFAHQSNTQSRDWYYVRVRQHNGQWAWSSPIWIEA